MKIDEILLEWEKDCQLNADLLDEEAVNISKLHAKYLRLLTENKARMKMFLITKDQVFSKLWNYYSGFYNNKEDLESIGREAYKINLNTKEIVAIINGDNEMVDLNKKLAGASLKVETLTEIVNELSKRGFNIKSAIDYLKIRGGHL